MDIATLQESWDTDSVLHLDRLTEHSLSIPYLHNKYYKILMAERIQLKMIEEELAATKLRKYELFMYGPDEDHRKLGWEIPHQRILKGDINYYFEGDKDLAKVRFKQTIQQEKVKFLEAIIHSINTRSFNIKNAVDFEKFRNGQ